MKNDNITSVLIDFMRTLQVPVTESTIVSELEKHPDHGTLFAVSDMLNAWRVPNASYELTFEELIGSGVSIPFIACLHKEFVLVNEIAEGYVIVSNQRMTRQKFSVPAFKKIFIGNILIAEKEENSGETDYSLMRRKELIEKIRIPFVVLASLALFFCFLLEQTSYLDSFGVQIALLTLFKTLGITTSILLLLQSIDANNPVIQKLCGGDSTKNCNAILSSKAAKISEELSWSEVGFFYFAGTWLTLLYNSNDAGVLKILLILNLLSLPYTVYSIYYQWRVAKQWCIFCCSIQALLWMEFFAFLPYLQQPFHFPEPGHLTNLIIELAIPILSWIFVKPYLLQTKQLKPIEQELRAFKYNTALFNKLLNQEPQYLLPKDEHSLILGNPEAERIITIVSNPYCQPCSRAHKKLDDWLNYKEDVKLQVVFTSGGYRDDPKAKVASHLMYLQSESDGISLKAALNDWYGQKRKNYEAWAKFHPVQKIEPVAPAVQIQREWCRSVNITDTPTIFIDGRRLPAAYKPEDIKYFL